MRRVCYARPGQVGREDTEAFASGNMLTKLRLRSAWLIVPLYLWAAEPTAQLIALGLVVAVLGGLVRAWAAGTIRKNRVLTTSGPYAYTRNPLYFGSFLIAIGLVIASGRWWFVLLLVAYVVVYHRVMLKEERRLERLFGDAFKRYEDAVPRFVPRLRPALVHAPVASDAASLDDEDNPAPAPMTGPRSAGTFFRRYLAHREYQALLGIAIMFVALIVKLAL